MAKNMAEKYGCGAKYGNIVLFIREFKIHQNIVNSRIILICFKVADDKHFQILQGKTHLVIGKNIFVNVEKFFQNFEKFFQKFSRF